MENDNQIIKHVLSGKNDYFSILMEKYHNEIFKYVYNILGNYQTTEDLLQEIFMKVFKNISKFDSSKAIFRTWLYRISSNHTMNYLNSKTYKNTFGYSIYEEETIGSDGDIESDIVKDEKINNIKRIMDKLLKPKHKEIMYLHYFSGLTVKEIGETTEIPEKTIYKAISTSVEKIKKEVALHERI